ncbi:uncharacterized protein LAESUDRAFT_714060 [Laetiporus sulphureus 93-53]|uniref:Uncharacterized protein n=1 Tax=Laetiporus sulphureus 93-53 TaxID=1314785 RepID=A0A165EAF1_9APHY|nr:uncharacterized protein LAESUDRAFT_714060 [Laetiporus sulphureus 93-53]KZT06590.1 hypothetical protein LAESUDRAFT_714060 [Laetiporus sulphureus 93-53]
MLDCWLKLKAVRAQIRAFVHVFRAWRATAAVPLKYSTCSCSNVTWLVLPLKPSSFSTLRRPTSVNIPDSLSVRHTSAIVIWRSSHKVAHCGAVSHNYAEAASTPSASTHYGPSNIGKTRSPRMHRNEREGAAEEANEEDNDENENEGDCEDENDDEGDSSKDDSSEDNGKDNGKDGSEDDNEDDGKDDIEDGSSKDGSNDDDEDDAQNLFKHELQDEAEGEGNHELETDSDQNAAKRNQRLIASRHKGVAWELFASDDGADNRIAKTLCSLTPRAATSLQASRESEESSDSRPANTYREKGKSHADLSDYTNADDNAIFNEDDERLGSVISDADNDGDDDGNGNDSDGVDDGPEKAERWTKTPGPFSKATKEPAEDLGYCVITEAEDITCQFSKGTHDVLIYANLGIKASHTLNHFNMFCTWYSDHHLFAQASNITPAEYSNMMDKAYCKLCESVKGDDNACERAFKLIFDYCNNLKKDPAHAICSVKSTTARMIRAHKQFMNLAGTYHNLEDMEIIRLSTLFDSSQYVMSLIEKNKIDAVKLWDDLTTAVKNVKLGQGHTNILFIGQYSDVKNPQHVPWKNWLNLAYKHSFTMVDWHDNVQPVPGDPKFEFKSLKTEELRKLVEGFLQREKSGATLLPIPHVERWSKSDLKMSDNNLGKGNIPLVIGLTSTKHKTLHDLTEWLRKLQKDQSKGAKKKRAHNHSLNINKDAGQYPLHMTDHHVPSSNVITVDSENEHPSSSPPCPHIPTARLTRIITIESNDELPSPLLHHHDVPITVPHVAAMHIDVIKRRRMVDEVVMMRRGKTSHIHLASLAVNTGTCCTPSEAVKAKLMGMQGFVPLYGYPSRADVFTNAYSVPVAHLVYMQQGNAIADSSHVHDNIGYPHYKDYLFDLEHEDYLSSDFKEHRHTGNKQNITCDYRRG